MVWIKLGILLIWFTQAGLLPNSIKKVLEYVNLDLKNDTLSFLSNKNLYGAKLVKRYKRLLFATALLTYTVFWLLTKYYDLGAYVKLMQYMDLGFASLALLAFAPHNLKPYNLKSLRPTLQHMIHNLLSIVVFSPYQRSLLRFK